MKKIIYLGIEVTATTDAAEVQASKAISDGTALVVESDETALSIRFKDAKTGDPLKAIDIAIIIQLVIFILKLFGIELPNIGDLFPGSSAQPKIA